MKDLDYAPLLGCPCQSRIAAEIEPRPGEDRHVERRKVRLVPWHTRADSLMRTKSPVVRADQELIGFQVRMDLDPSDSHLRPTITVVDGDGLVIGFISHPEQVPGVEIVWG